MQIHATTQNIVVICNLGGLQGECKSRCDCVQSSVRVLMTLAAYGLNMALELRALVI